MTPEAFADLYPRLYHMTAAGGWEGIRADGLLPVARLLDRQGADPDVRESVQFSRRPEQIELAPGVVVRDNKILNEKALARALRDGLTPRDWYGILNARVFFWVNPARLDGLLAARPYRDRAHDVLAFDTLGVVRSRAGDVECAPINTGAAIMKAAPRGLSTFVPLADLPYEAWRKRRGRADAVVEVAVPGGVPDAGDHLLEVRRRRAGTPGDLLWSHRRPS